MSKLIVLALELCWKTVWLSIWLCRHSKLISSLQLIFLEMYAKNHEKYQKNKSHYYNVTTFNDIFLLKHRLRLITKYPSGSKFYDDTFSIYQNFFLLSCISRDMHQKPQKKILIIPKKLHYYDIWPLWTIF